MMSKRLVIAEIAILVLAGLMVGEAAATIRLDEKAHGHRHAFVGELIQVGIHYAVQDVTSSDQSIVKPIGVTNGNPTVRYFVAALPGKAILTAAPIPCRQVCTEVLVLLWTFEIDVG